MLITELKPREALMPLLSGKLFLISCGGCREVRFPEQAVGELEKELLTGGKATGLLAMDYICNADHLAMRIRSRSAMLEEADAVLVFSCGVGVQTAAEIIPDKRICAGCDTLRLPGFQGVTPLEVDCEQCGECFLNLTGGICPITACSKSLVNGPCGGAKNGKCEVDSGMDCGWERIYRRLEATGRLDALRCPTQVRSYAHGERSSE